MRVRKVDANGDRVFGHGLNDFWINVPDGVGQTVSSRLRLWYGQWFLNPTDGTNWQRKILGKYTAATRDIEIQSRIVTTPGVKQLSGYSSSVNPNTRDWPVQGTIDTDYGQFILPGPF